jgi:hypothetical protein
MFLLKGPSHSAKTEPRQPLRAELEEAERAAPGLELYRQEDDPFLNGVLLDLSAEDVSERIVEPEAEPRRQSVEPPSMASEPMTDAEPPSERRERRIPVLGISLFALFVAAGAAYSSLRMPVGDGAVAAASAPAAETDAAPVQPATAGADLAASDKVQDRIPEGTWAPPPPLSPVPSRVATTATQFAAGTQFPAAAPAAPTVPAAAPAMPASAPSPEMTAAIPAAPSVSSAAAVARTAVNLRSGPDRSSTVVMVVAAGTPVEVLSCDYWCNVEVSGQRGWIYQDYLDGPIRRQ